MLNSKTRPNVRLPYPGPPLDLAPEPIIDRIMTAAWWVCLALVAGFWYLVWTLVF